MSEIRRRGRRKRRPTKDRVLQARIPEQLDAQLRDRAEQLGLSVSTIVRNTLLHTFDLVEGVVADSAQVARILQGRGESESQPPPSEPDSAAPGNRDAVVGWQEATMNRNGVCEQCNAILPTGERAAIGVPVRSRPVLLCLPCLAALCPATQEAPAAEASEKVSEKAPVKKPKARAKPAS